MLCWGLTTREPLRVILCRLPEKGRKEIEERVEEMKERDREERGTGMNILSNIHDNYFKNMTSRVLTKFSLKNVTSRVLTKSLDYEI